MFVPGSVDGALPRVYPTRSTNPGAGNPVLWGESGVENARVLEHLGRVLRCPEPMLLTAISSLECLARPKLGPILQYSVRFQRGTATPPRFQRGTAPV